MTEPYWDELGIAWVATVPETQAISPAVKKKLRRQSRLISAGVVLSASLSVVGLILGLATIWIGLTTGAWNFISRGIAVLAVAALAATATRALFPVRGSEEARSLSDMIDLSLLRARRSDLTITLGLYACAVAALFGLIGAAIRSQLSGPPKMSPIVDLAFVALVALALGLCRGRVRHTLVKFQYLQRALAADTGIES